MKVRHTVAVSVGLVFALAGGVTVAVSARAAHERHELPDWVTICGKAYPGRTADEIRSLLSGWQTAERRRSFTLVVTEPARGRRMWTTMRGVLGAEPDLDAMIQKAFTAADSEGFMERLGRWLGRKNPVDIGPLWRVDSNTLETWLRRRVAPLVQRKPVDARLRLESGRPVVTQDSPGQELELPAAVGIVSRALYDPNSEEAEVPVRSVPADVTVSDAAGIEAEIASFETHYAEKGNRRRNLELACSLVNGTIIKPGGVFSFNEAVGPREATNGFRVAPVIVQGRMEAGMGGGVCQVSSTVYNAALLAGLDVVARHHHAFPVHYLPPGRDATVVYGAIDLKLKNNTGSAIGFIADGTNGKVRVRVFGRPRPGVTISLERSGISSWAPPVKTLRVGSLPLGKTVVKEPGRAGHRVSVWRVYRERGRVVRREIISRDLYRAFPRIVWVGIAPKSPATSVQPVGEATVPPSRSLPVVGSGQSTP